MFPGDVSHKVATDGQLPFLVKRNREVWVIVEVNLCLI